MRAAAAIKLERDGLIEKTQHPEDRRVAALHATSCGTAAIVRIFGAIDRALGDADPTGLCGDCESEVARLLLVAAPRLGIPVSEDSTIVHDRVSPAFLMVVAALLRLWSSTIAKRIDLTLAGYRCLAVLQGGRRALPCCALADALVVDRSTVSAVLKPPCRRGLAVVERGKTGGGGSYR